MSLKSQLLKTIIREEVKRAIREAAKSGMLNELSPELLQRASAKAKEQGRTLQANKFANAAATQIYKKAQADRAAELDPMEPFNGKMVNFYYDLRDRFDKVMQSVEVPHKIQTIEVDTNGVMVVHLYGKNDEAGKIEGYRSDKIFAFVPNDDHYKISNWGWQGQNFMIKGMDQPSAQLFFKLAKAFKPDTTVTPNTLINGAPTPIKGKAF